MSPRLRGQQAFDVFVARLREILVPETDAAKGFGDGHGDMKGTLVVQARSADAR